MRDCPGLLTAEEVLHCLSDPEVRVLVNTVVAQLSGGQMIFDICNAMIMKRTGANVGGHGRIPPMDPGGFQEIRQLVPKLELITEYKPSEMAAFPRFLYWWRALYRIQEINLTLRSFERMLFYRYSNASSETRS